MILRVGLTDLVHTFTSTFSLTRMILKWVYLWLVFSSHWLWNRFKDLGSTREIRLLLDTISSGDTFNLNVLKLTTRILPNFILPTTPSVFPGLHLYWFLWWHWPWSLVETTVWNVRQSVHYLLLFRWKTVDFCRVYFTCRSRLDSFTFDTKIVVV